MTSAATATQERTTDYNPLLKAAVEYARRGFPIFPCKRADKKPLVRHGFKDATTDERQIREWWQKWPQAMIGMPTGGTSGIDVLDLDLKPDEYIDGSKLVPDWDQRSCVLVRTPSGGAHVWFKSTGKVRNSTDRIAPGVDTRGDGGYVIVPPSRNLTGDGYRFIKGGIEDIAQQLPPFSEDLLDKLGAKHEERPGTNPKSSPERIHAAMEAIPNPDLGWDDWKKFGMAIWRATSGSEAGFSIFDEWSRKSSKYDAENTQAAWQEITNSPPSRIGPGTIFYHAKEANRQTAMAGGATAVLQTSTPVASAREFVRQGYQNNEASGLIYYRGSFYEWGGSHYEECDDDHLRSKLYEFLDNALTPDGDPFNPTKQKVNNIIDALKAGVEQNSKHNTPFWLDDVGRDASNLIACRNGLLNIQQCAAFGSAMPTFDNPQRIRGL